MFAKLLQLKWWRSAAATLTTAVVLALLVMFVILPIVDAGYHVGALSISAGLSTLLIGTIVASAILLLSPKVKLVVRPRVYPVRSDRPGAMRTFLPTDATKPFAGWRAIAGDAMGGLFNPRGWAAIHVVVQKIVDGSLNDAYDQIVLVEDPGAVVVCRLGDYVAFVQNFRFTAKRALSMDKGYVRLLAEQGRWDELLASLGTWQWELPRGMAPSQEEQTDLATYVLKTAKLEALSEAGIILTNARVCGPLSLNSTFFVHPQMVVAGDIAETGEQLPESLEMLGAVRLFSRHQLREMIASGQLEDGPTLAALAVSGFWFDD